MMPWCYIIAMRTTLDIDTDILETARKMAEIRRVSTGKMISELVRKGLETPNGEIHEVRNGFPQFPRTGQTISVEMIEDMLEDEDREIIREALPKK